MALKNREWIEKFVLEMIRDVELKRAVTDLFNSLKLDTGSTGYRTLLLFASEIPLSSLPEQRALISGLVTGVVFTQAMQGDNFSQYVREMILKNNKAKGENVVDFFHKKAEQQ